MSRTLNVDRMRRYAHRGRTTTSRLPAWRLRVERPLHYPSAHYTLLDDGTVLDHTPFLATNRSNRGGGWR